MQLAPYLKIGRGVTAVIGGGGKTTLCLTLARELRRRGQVIFCTSTHIRPANELFLAGDPTESELSAALAREGAVCIGRTTDEGKFTSPTLPMAALARLADYVLVEADGSRGLPLKAHAPHEPAIPPEASRVVLVVGADGFSRPIGEVCHRSALYAQRALASESDPVTPRRAAAVLRAEGFGDRVFINKVESAQDMAAAEELARQLDCPVTAGSLHRGVYLCLR